MTRALLCMMALALAGIGHALTLCQDGKSDYVIVLGAEASLSEQYAATELQQFLREISGAELPIIADDQPLKPHEIILGSSNVHLRQLDGISVLVGVLNGARSVADMPDGWQTIEMGEFVPANGAHVYAAPPENGDNVAWVYVDRFVFEKVNE